LSHTTDSRILITFGSRSFGSGLAHRNLVRQSIEGGIMGVPPNSAYVGIGTKDSKLKGLLNSISIAGSDNPLVEVEYKGKQSNVILTT